MLLGAAPSTRTPTATSTPTSTRTATATPSATMAMTSSTTPTLSPTTTPTLVLCPADGASATLKVDNRTGASPIALILSGRLLTPTCRSLGDLAEFYRVVSDGSPAALSQLAPGLWIHTLAIDTPATGQRQHQTELMLANSGPTVVRFRAFASVFPISTNAGDASVGSLNDALLRVVAAPKPALIQFDEAAFPPAVQTTITPTNALPVLSANDVTLDGVDSTGAIGNRVIDAGGQPIPALAITGASNTVRGIGLRNTGANNRDVLSVSGRSAQSNLVDRCVIQQSATGDGIGIDGGAGSDFLGSANIVRNSEISGAGDKGVKVTTNSFARLEDNWIHDNLNGGIQATLSGHITARDNLVEHSGGASAQNGLSVNGPAPDTPAIPSELITDGNISRFNAASGIALRGYSIGVLNNDDLVANGSSGLRVADDGVSGAAAVVVGVTAACNGVDGAVVAGSGRADLGGGPFGSPGNNAFTQNNLPAGGANLRNATGTLLFAQNNQWEHCGHNTACDDGAIAAYDVSDHGAQTIFSPAQPHRTLRAPALTGTRPTKGLAGDVLRIFGSGFDVVDGHAADATCPDVAERNRCVPLRGNCVRIGNLSVRVEAVTPTMLVVRLPVSCVQPQSLTVQTQDGGLSTPFLVCTNAP